MAPSGLISCCRNTGCCLFWLRQRLTWLLGMAFSHKQF